MTDSSDTDFLYPEHYRASVQVIGSGPLREMGSLLKHPVSLAHWRVGAVERVNHINDSIPTLLFHAAGGPVDSEPCNRFRAAGRSWPGASMFVPEGAEVNCSWTQPVEYLHVYFRPDYLQQIVWEEQGQLIREIQDRSHVRAQQLIDVLRPLLRQHWEKNPDKLLMDGLALNMAAEILATFSPGAVKILQRRNSSITPRQLRNVMEKVESSLDRPIALHELANAAGLSQFHFVRAFRSEVGCTPYQFVIQRRVEHVKRMLSSNAIPIAAIAQRTGFSSPGHLSTVFRNLTGLSPMAWRKLR